VIKKPRERGGHSPRWATEPEKIIIIIIIIIIMFFDNHSLKYTVTYLPFCNDKGKGKFHPRTGHKCSEEE
jgi:hypothetical protein